MYSLLLVHDCTRNLVLSKVPQVLQVTHKLEGSDGRVSFFCSIVPTSTHSDPTLSISRNRSSIHLTGPDPFRDAAEPNQRVPKFVCPIVNWWELTHEARSQVDLIASCEKRSRKSQHKYHPENEAEN